MVDLALCDMRVSAHSIWPAKDAGSADPRRARIYL